MGNAIYPACFHPIQKSSIKLVFFEGTTTIVAGKRLAGEVMFQYPDKIICHGNSFFIGHPILALSIDDELISGETYFVLPIERFAGKILSTALLSALGSSPKPQPINFGDCPFQYVKGENGKVMIKVLPEFIMKLLSRSEEKGSCSNTDGSFLCSTPELQKHYEQLVGSKEQVWSPKLDTISEYKIRLSPLRLFGLERKLKEMEG